MEKDKIKKMYHFSEMARNACEKSDTVYQFDCPICGSKAKAVKNGYNGHHRGACEGCGMSFNE